MKRITTLEIIFGLFALGLIYFVIVNNASITGFVITPSNEISPVSPSDNYQTSETSVEFIFKYPYESDMAECSLIINDEVAKTTKGLLSSRDTRIRSDLVPGTFSWRIECIDSSNVKLVSATRKLIIGEEEEPELKITKFADRYGFMYEFEIKQGLDLRLEEILPNDVIRAKQEDNAYDINILRIVQDYNTGREQVDVMITPGSKRLRITAEEITSLDFNNDGAEDLMIRLDDVSYRKAYFTIMTKKAPEEQKPELIEAPKILILVENPQKEEKVEEPVKDIKKGLGVLEILLIGLIIVIIIAIIAVARSKKDEEKEYITRLKKKSAMIKKKIKKKVKKKSKKKKAKKKTKKKAVTKKITVSSKKKTLKKPVTKKITVSSKKKTLKKPVRRLRTKKTGKKVAKKKRTSGKPIKRKAKARKTVSKKKAKKKKSKKKK